MNKKNKSKMKEDAVYNEADNSIYVRSQNDKLFIICNNMEQVDKVQKRLHKSGNIMINFEEWDEDEDRKYMITFQIRDGRKPIYN